MIPALKSEFRKLLTVRSSYVIPGIAYALLIFVLFYVVGYRNGQVNTQGPGASFFLANSISQTANVLSIFGAMAALLLMTHEYRYSTIMYSLTIVNSRTKVLLSKVVAIVAYIFVFALVGVGIALGGQLLGLHFSGASLPPQHFSLVNYVVETLVFCEAWALASLLFAALIRNQVAAIAVLFIVPNTVEGLLSLLLKENVKYLPFTALLQVVTPPVNTSTSLSSIGVHAIWTPPQAVLIFLAYLVGGWAIGWILFLRRDAN